MVLFCTQIMDYQIIRDDVTRIVVREVLHDLIEEAAREAALQRAAERIVANAVQSAKAEFLQECGHTIASEDVKNHEVDGATELSKFNKTNEEADTSATQDEVLTLGDISMRETARKMSWDNDTLINTIHNALTFRLRLWVSSCGWCHRLCPFPWSSSLPYMVSVFSSGSCPSASWTRRGQKHEKKHLVDICPRLGSQRRVAANWLWDTYPRQSWPHVAKKEKGQWTLSMGITGEVNLSYAN